MYNIGATCTSFKLFKFTDYFIDIKHLCTTLGQTLQNFKICPNLYFRGIALFKHLKMSQKIIFHKINLKCPKIRYIMHDQLLRYLA